MAGCSAPGLTGDETGVSRSGAHDGVFPWADRSNRRVHWSLRCAEASCSLAWSRVSSARRHRASDRSIVARAACHIRSAVWRRRSSACCKASAISSGSAMAVLSGTMPDRPYLADYIPETYDSVSVVGNPGAFPHHERQGAAWVNCRAKHVTNRDIAGQFSSRPQVASWVSANLSPLLIASSGFMRQVCHTGQEPGTWGG
jgi:hypothetical protein